MNSPLIKALGATLFHFLWEGLAIALLFAACRAKPAARYRLACVAMFAMPAVFFATFLILLPENAARFPVFTGFAALTEAATLPSTHTGAVSLLERAQAAMRWFVPFWLAGMALFCLRNLLGWTAAQRLRRIGSTPAPAFWQHRLNQLAESLGITAAVILLASRRLDVPVVAGVLRPVILVPASLFTGLPAEQFEYLLLHELAHIRRFDYAVNLAQRAIESLLFYHPAVWWISGVLREEREHCCDDIVLAHGANPKAYAITLASLESARPRLALAANGGSLTRRVRRILKSPESPRVAGAPFLSAALLALTLVAASVVFHAPAPLAAQTTASAAAGPYEKWLTEDVVYIITAEERRRFLELQANEEKDMFIRQFWQRRGAGFREEHYRRIARANARYAEGIPGWKTDRGRIYITYGPPDEIDSHPSGSAQDSTPWEEWLYRHIEGVGNNVKIDYRDTEHNGRFHMTMDPHPQSGLLVK